MSVPINNIVIPQGTDWSEQFQLLDELGEVILLSTVTSIVGQAKRIVNGVLTTAFTFTITLNTGTNIVTSSVAKSITTALIVGPTTSHPDSKFFYDYEILMGGVTSRLIQGSCIVDREITTI